LAQVGVWLNFGLLRMPTPSTRYRTNGRATDFSTGAGGITEERFRGCRDLSSVSRNLQALSGDSDAPKAKGRAPESLQNVPASPNAKLTRSQRILNTGIPASLSSLKTRTHKTLASPPTSRSTAASSVSTPDHCSTGSAEVPIPMPTSTHRLRDSPTQPPLPMPTSTPRTRRIPSGTFDEPLPVGTSMFPVEHNTFIWDASSGRSFADSDRSGGSHDTLQATSLTNSWACTHYEKDHDQMQYDMDLWRETRKIMDLGQSKVSPTSRTHPMPRPANKAEARQTMSSNLWGKVTASTSAVSSVVLSFVPHDSRFGRK